MPTQAVGAETMQVGKKGGGKHWTAAEKAAREKAQAELTRVAPLLIEPPTWLGKEAAQIWRESLALANGTNLFDKLDSDTLATYCDAVAQYRKHAQKKRRSLDDIKIQQAWARIIATYADKLGFTPSARARLIKKRAEKIEDKFGQKFD